MSAPFVYVLPDERIAQRPVYPYDSAKLLCVHGSADSVISDSVFSALPTLLRRGDLLVLNNTVVRPARFLGKLQTGGGVELLIVGKRGEREYEAIARPMRKLEEGTSVIVDSSLAFTVARRVSDKTVLVKAEISHESDLNSHGIMPIPPYIRGGKGDDRDREDYQSRFAAASGVSAQSTLENFGSIAAPTASLHFTESLVAALDELGVRREYLTLDVGLASVLSVVQEDGSVRPPGAERVAVPRSTIVAIEQTRQSGGRVVAVGTTVVRALENYALNPQAEFADIFINPGHAFRNVDAMITNFHQPGSSHLLLVEAFIGAQKLKTVYEYALAHEYQFLSYGDAMYLQR